jgi:hypothetical protein
MCKIISDTKMSVYSYFNLAIVIVEMHLILVQSDTDMCIHTMTYLMHIWIRMHLYIYIYDVYMYT